MGFSPTSSWIYKRHVWKLMTSNFQYVFVLTGNEVEDTRGQRPSDTAIAKKKEKKRKTTKKVKKTNNSIQNKIKKTI